MALSPLLMPQGIMASMTQQPTAVPTVQPMMPKPAAQSTSLEDLTRALSGDFASSLSGGDRLMALSALMRSATRSGRQAGLTPQQVVGDLRQQQVQQIQSRMQIEQLRAAEAQRQQQMAAGQQFAQTLEEPQRVAFLGLPLEQQMSRMEQEAFRPRQAMWRDRDPATGNMRITFSSGDTVVTDQPMPPNGEWQPMDINGRQEEVWLDKDTGRPLRDEAGELITRYTGVSPNTEASIAATNTRFYEGQNRADARSARSGGGGGGTELVPYLLSDGRVVSQQGVPTGGGYFRLTTGPHAGTVVMRAGRSAFSGGSNRPNTRTAPPAN